MTELLTEGGAAGHLAHPFEDADLTFADLKEMIHRGLTGGLDKEGPVTEKLDGQNIAFSVRDGKIVFARNKGHVQNGGEKALDRDGIAQNFKGRGAIEKAFGGAAEDLDAAVQKLSPEERKKMFGNGSKFMSLEIILPDTQNVIPYGKSVLVMHGTISYDKDGNQIGRNSKDGTDFAAAVKKVGADRQKTFGIAGANTIAFSSADESGNKKLAKQYTDELDKSAKEFGLSDKSKLSDYRKKWWEREVDTEVKKAGVTLSKQERAGLVKRWADGDKAFGSKNFQEEKKKKWFKDYEDKKLASSQKRMIKPVESTFLRAGAQTLRRVTNFVSANNPEATKQLKKDVATAIKAVKGSKDPAKLAKLQTELERLSDIGMDNVVPSEGVVFMYNGKPYKFTGAFAPINQINGTFKFDKPAEAKKPESKPKEKYEKETKKDEKKKAEGKPKKSIAIFAGRFQPFHAGHYSVYKELSKRFGKENVYIASSNVTDDVRSPFAFRDKHQIITSMFDVPKGNVVQVKNPYQPTEILNKVGKDTIYVTAVSQKDAERLEQGKYFKNYDKTNKGKHKAYEDEGYFIVAPEMQLKVNGGNISGTQLRATFGNPLLSDSEKRDIFKQVYGKFDKTIYDKIVKTTTKAEKAKVEQQANVKSKGKKDEKPAKGKKTIDISKLSKGDKKKLKKVLTTKIKNPETGNQILVRSALNYKKGSKVRKAAEDQIKNALNEINEMFPGGIFMGLTSPTGYINGAPKPKNVKRMRKKLNKTEVIKESVNTKDIKKMKSLEDDGRNTYNPIANHHAFNSEEIVAVLSEFINEEMDSYFEEDVLHEKEETAAEKAKKQGLKSRGFGRWSKDDKGPITHKTVDGNLTQLSPEDSEKETEKDQKGIGDEEGEEKVKGGEPKTPEAPPEQKLGGAELKSDAEKAKEKEKQEPEDKKDKHKEKINKQIQNERKELTSEENQAYELLDGVSDEDKAQVIDKALNNRSLWEKFTQDTMFGNYLKKKKTELTNAYKGLESFVKTGRTGVHQDCSGAPAGPHTKSGWSLGTNLTEDNNARAAYLSSLDKTGNKKEKNSQNQNDKSKCKDVHFSDYQKRDNLGKRVYKKEPLYKKGKVPNPAASNSGGSNRYGKFTQSDIDSESGYYKKDGKYYDATEKEVDKNGNILGADGNPQRARGLFGLGPPKTKKVPVYEDNLSDEQKHAAHESYHKAEHQQHAIKHTAMEVGAIVGGAIFGGPILAKLGIGHAAGAGATQAAAHTTTQTVSHGAAEIATHIAKDAAKHAFFETIGMSHPVGAAGAGLAVSAATGGLLESFVKEMSLLLESDGKDFEKKFFVKAMKMTLEKMKTFKMTPEQKLESLRTYKLLKIKKQKEKQKADLLNLLKENISDTKKESIQNFVEYATKRLKLKEKPNVQLVSNSEMGEMGPSLGGYNPETKSITVQSEKRLSADILRTVAHEMVHRKQDEMGMIKDPIKDGATGSPLENQANAVAGILLREYGKLNKQIYTESKQYLEQTLNEAIIDDKLDKAFLELKNKLKNEYNFLDTIQYDTHDKVYTFVFSNKTDADRFRNDFKGTETQIAQFDRIYSEPKENPTTFYVKFKTAFKEDINVTVNPGDEILMGKFKNKRVKIKDIGKDDHGMPTINGRAAVTFRTKKENINEVSALAGSDAQPDGAFLPKGKTRVLGRNDGVNKTDKWYTNGGYTQTDFPTADPILGDDDADAITIDYSQSNLPRTEKKIETDFLKEAVSIINAYKRYTKTLFERKGKKR